jgi:hypothetical protein
MTFGSISVTDAINSSTNPVPDPDPDPDQNPEENPVVGLVFHAVVQGETSSHPRGDRPAPGTASTSSSSSESTSGSTDQPTSATPSPDEHVLPPAHQSAAGTDAVVDPRPPSHVRPADANATRCSVTGFPQLEIRLCLSSMDLVRRWRDLAWQQDQEHHLSVF